MAGPSLNHRVIIIFYTWPWCNLRHCRLTWRILLEPKETASNINLIELRAPSKPPSCNFFFRICVYIFEVMSLTRDKQMKRKKKLFAISKVQTKRFFFICQQTAKCETVISNGKFLNILLVTNFRKYKWYLIVV